MPIDLYYKPVSAPSNAVLFTARVLGIPLNLIYCDTNKGDHLTPEFLKLNPTHTVPTLVDADGFSVWESRNIIVYLASKYGKDDSLFPGDLQQRSVVLQRLFFDVTVLYQRFADYFFSQLFDNQPANPKLFDRMQLALGFLDGFVADSKWAAGDRVTVADLSLVPTILAYRAASVDLSGYPNLVRWFEQCREIEGFAEVEKNIEEFVGYFDVLKK